MRFALLLLVLCLPGICSAQQPNAAETPANPTTVFKPASKPKPTAAAKSTTTAKPAPTAKPAKSAPKNAFITEAEISGLTSETNDQLYTQLNLRRISKPVQWYLRTGYRMSTSRSFSKKRTYESEVDTYNLDSQYRLNGKGRYKFISATANIRERTPKSAVYADKAGYYLFSAGVGRNLAPGLDSELALASIGTYHGEVESGMTLVPSLRWKRTFTDEVSMDGHAYFIRPFTEDVLMDSRVDLTYKFAPGLSLRCSYIANNLLQPLSSRTGWDKSLRITLVFSRTVD